MVPGLRVVLVSGGYRGLCLLTGSATVRVDAHRHSGAGRIGMLRMRPMRLAESGHSNASVSLAALLDETAQRGADVRHGVVSTAR